jgi:hypothetical protein
LIINPAPHKELRNTNSAERTQMYIYFELSIYHPNFHSQKTQRKTPSPTKKSHPPYYYFFIRVSGVTIFQG